MKGKQGNRENRKKSKENREDAAHTGRSPETETGSQNKNKRYEEKEYSEGQQGG